MNRYKLLGIALVAGSMLVAGPVAAQGYDSDFEETPQTETQVQGVGQQDEVAEPGYDEPIEEPLIEPVAIDDPYAAPTPLVEPDGPGLLTPFGMGLTVGGGVVGFTDSDFNNALDTGGGWEARMIFGTRLPVSFEAAYIGSANELKTFGVEDDAILLSNGVEGSLRLNLGTAAIQPYLLAGVGWKHYTVENTDINTSSLEDSDNVIKIPMGVGLSYSFNRFIADVRGTFRPAFDNELMRNEVANDANELHTWRASANIGFEF